MVKKTVSVSEHEDEDPDHLGMADHKGQKLPKTGQFCYPMERSQGERRKTR